MTVTIGDRLSRILVLVDIPAYRLAMVFTHRRAASPIWTPQIDQPLFE